MSNGSEHIDENYRDDQLDETHVAYLTEQDVAAMVRATTPGVIYVHEDDDE